MRAAVIDRYGGREVLELREVVRPLPAVGEILIRVRASGINPVEWKIRNGLLRPVLPRSFPHILGSDVAGVVEEVGGEVTCQMISRSTYALGSVFIVRATRRKAELNKFLDKTSNKRFLGTP
jgi:NADPH:quinone reductase-like Zn-dependent oxidoreductase